MPKLEYSPMALEDLQYIHSYILANWGENVAKRILKKITTNIRSLEEHPLLGVGLGKIIDVPTDYRYLFIDKNYIFYHLESDKVRVVRILNDQQDYMLQLFGKRVELEEDYWNDNN
jgi:plasmid stabilization system protein ParE